MRLRLGFKRKGKNTPVSEKRLEEVMKGELSVYIKSEELQAHLDEIERDKRKKKLWESLSARKKLKVLRYMKGKKGEQYGKR